MPDRYLNEVPRCGQCERPATCLKQGSTVPPEWDWRCNHCSDHGMESTAVCVPAADVPGYHSTLELQIPSILRERDEALRVIERRLGAAARRQVEVTLEKGERTDTCLLCGGSGRRMGRRGILMDAVVFTIIAANVGVITFVFDPTLALPIGSLTWGVLMTVLRLLMLRRCRHCAGAGHIISSERN